MLILILKMVDGVSSGKSLKSQFSKYKDGLKENKNAYSIAEEDDDVAEERLKIETGKKESSSSLDVSNSMQLHWQHS